MERKNLITVRVSPDELEKIKDVAGKSGMNISDYFRSTVINGHSGTGLDPGTAAGIIQLLSLFLDVAGKLHMSVPAGSDPEPFRKLHGQLILAAGPLINKLETIRKENGGQQAPGQQPEYQAAGRNTNE